MGRGGPDPGPKVWALIALHDEHAGAFEASLIRAGVRWRDIGSSGFSWGDAIALVENLPWNDPLAIAMRPEEWAWDNPDRDVLVSILDVLVQINAKTLTPREVGRSRMPKRIPRPWDRRKRKTAPAGPAMEWDAAMEWLSGRVKRRE